MTDISLVQTASVDELDAYLQKPMERIKDPLQWWVNNKSSYPSLSRMALDYLSIPGMSHLSYVQ